MPSPILQFFAYAHLPEHLRDISQQYYALARKVEDTYPDTHPAEKATVLRKLLEAKDAAVRCHLPKEAPQAQAQAPELPFPHDPRD